MRRPVRIANCSGFYGDRRSAAREMVDGGPIDVLTGDWLAELTMMILAGAQARPDGVGWARTFLPQLEDVLATCQANGTRIVSNAGGLDPAGCAEAVRALARRLDLDVAVAHVTGDDLRADLTHVRPRVAGTPIVANAYLGGWGIARALAAGADVVVTGRVTDASLVVGPAAWWHDWQVDAFDALAGAVAAGHVIECGAQATGGNYPFLAEIGDRRAPGFPLAEVAEDGSSTITKHPDTGGVVSIGTVTAQLLYEIGPPAYANPDVTAHFDTITLTTEGPDRVHLAGLRGTPPPADLKVAVATAGGYRNTMTLVLTGLDIVAKAARAEEMVFARLGGRDRFDEVEVELVRFDRADAPTNVQATAHLRITVKDVDRDLVGRTFTDAVVEQALAGYAGFHTTTPPTPASAFGIFTASSVPRAAVQHVVVLPDGSRETVDDPPLEGARPDDRPDDTAARPGDGDPSARSGGGGPTRRVPLGRVCGARSGDKGGDANIGVWTSDDDTWSWLRSTLTTTRLRELLGPEVEDLVIERHELPNLRALNVVVRGLLGHGVASSTRPDPQAKGLGEYLRSRLVDVPEHLLDHVSARPSRHPTGQPTRQPTGHPNG